MDKKSLKILVAIFLMLNSFVICALGQKEGIKSTVNKLIAKKEYSNALSAVSLAMKDDLKNFEKYQALIDKILAKKNQDQNLIIKAIKNIKDNPNGVKQTMDLVNDAKQKGGKDNQEILDYTNKVAVLERLKNGLQEIMEHGRMLLLKKENADAISNYILGFELGKSDFEHEKMYPKSFKEEVLLSMDKIKMYTKEFQDINKTIRDKIENIKNLDVLSNSFKEYFQNDIANKISYIDTLKSGVKEEFDKITQLGDQIYKFRKDDPYDSYISMVQRVISGDKDKNDGIINAMEGDTTSSIDILVNNFENKRENLSNNFIKNTENSPEDVKNKAKDTLKAQSDKVDNYIVKSLELYKNKNQDTILKYQGIIAKKELENKKYKYVVEISKINKKEAELEKEIKEKGNFNEKIADIENNISNIEDVKKNWQTDFDKLKTENPDLANNSVEVKNDLDKNITELENKISSYLGTDYIAYINSKSKDNLKLKEELQKEISNIEVKSNGVEDENNIKRYYLDDVLNGYKGVTKKVETPLKEGENAIRIYEKIPEQFKTKESENTIKSITGLKDDFAGIMKKSNEAIKQIGEKITKAQKLKQEALSNINEIKNNLAAGKKLNKGNIEELLKKYYNVEEVLYSSLSIKEDPEIRKYIENDLDKLYVGIKESETESQIREGREDIQSAIDMLKKGDYETALTKLDDATEKYGNIIGKHEILEYIRSIARSYKKIDRDSKLHENEPLFRTLISYLDLAKESYNRALKNLLDAKNLYKESQNYIQKFLELKPNHIDARRIEFLILKEMNPDKFKEIYKERKQASLKLIEEDKYAEALMELKALYSAQQDKEVANAINNIEIRLGLKKSNKYYSALEEIELKLNPSKDLDFAKRKQSSLNLLSKVKRELTVNKDKDKLNQSLTSLKKAIELDPENKNALLLYDEISTTLGKESIIKLDPTDEKAFVKARFYYSQNQIVKAYEIVKELLGKSVNNTKYQPLLNLEEKIKKSL